MTFPTSPTNGQQSTQNGVVYTWNSTLTAWTVTTNFVGNITVNQIQANAVTASGNVSATFVLGNVAFATGTVISLVNNSTGNLIIGRQDAVSLYLGGNATSAGRTITSYGVATLMKVATDTWFINGSGVV